MRTPAGKECKHYHQDFHRGRNIQECRLAKENPNSTFWKPSDCAKCPVPAILDANASKNMELTLTIKSSMMGLRRTLDVDAYCTKHRAKITDPYVGCPQCNKENPGLDLLRQAFEDSDG